MASMTVSQMTCRSAQRVLQRPFASLKSAAQSLSARQFSARPHLLTPVASPRTQAPRRGLNSQIRAMGGVSQPDEYAFEIFCKGAPEGGNPSTKGTLLDCPFSQRVMLMMEEKGVKYLKQLCDEQDLPEFLGQYQPGGKPLIPVLKDVQADKYIGDSDKIVTYLEEKYPEPKFGTPDSCSKAGEGLFPDTCMNFLLAEGADVDKAQQELEAKYQEVEDALGEKGGPFISGEKPCARCIALAPQLYHISIATARIKDFPISKKYSKIHEFIGAWKARPSWAPTAPVNDDAVEDGWRTKIKQKKESS